MQPIFANQLPGNSEQGGAIAIADVNGGVRLSLDVLLKESMP
jgi:hypothetical protein